MTSLIWADPTRPITEAMVTYRASEAVSYLMHLKAYDVSSFSFDHLGQERL
jgi:hypothetical protein